MYFIKLSIFLSPVVEIYQLIACWNIHRCVHPLEQQVHTSETHSTTNDDRTMLYLLKFISHSAGVSLCSTGINLHWTCMKLIGLIVLEKLFRNKESAQTQGRKVTRMERCKDGRMHTEGDQGGNSAPLVYHQAGHKKKLFYMFGLLIWTPTC